MYIPDVHCGNLGEEIPCLKKGHMMSVSKDFIISHSPQCSQIKLQRCFDFLGGGGQGGCGMSVLLQGSSNESSLNVSCSNLLGLSIRTDFFRAALLLLLVILLDSSPLILAFFLPLSFHSGSSELSTVLFFRIELIERLRLLLWFLLGLLGLFLFLFSSSSTSSSGVLILFSLTSASTSSFLNLKSRKHMMISLLISFVDFPKKLVFGCPP